jgi:4-amino-4-deoxy-L-arabinose transferase-like glycosyltransferase
MKEETLSLAQAMNDTCPVLRPPSSVFLWSVRGVVIVAFLLWSATQLDGFSWDYDEGTHTYEAWHVQLGHPLYTQTFSAYTPGFIMSLVAAYQLGGATMFTARLVAVGFASLGVLGVMLIAGELSAAALTSSAALPYRGVYRRSVVEVGAMLLLTLTPSFYQWSRAAMSDVPAMAVMTLAVGLTLRYAHTQRLRWLWGAEVVAAFALWIKAIAIGGALACLLITLWAWRARRLPLRRALGGSLLIGCLALLPLVFFDLNGLYAQAIYFHTQKRAVYDDTWMDNVQVLWEFLVSNWTLTTLATLGVIASLLHSLAVVRQQGWLMLSWFALTFVSLLAQVPLFANHHPVVLVFPLAALAGATVAHLLAVWRHPISQPKLFLQRILLIGGYGLATLGLPDYPERLSAVARPPLQPLAVEAMNLLRAVTAPEDLLVSDAQVIAFRAQRQSPPSLADTAEARLRSGNLTAEQLIVITQQSQANGVLFWSGRLASAPAFVKWTEQNYYPVRAAFQQPNSPYRLLLREPHPQYPLDVRIGEGIRLWGYDLQRRESAPIVAGQTLSLTLYFQRIGAVERAYTVFAHLLNADGQIAAQADRPPFAGRYPTDQWRMNEWLVDEFVFTLQPTLLAGAYTIALGMYQGDTRAPLTQASVRLAADRLVLPAVSVRAK